MSTINMSNSLRNARATAIVTAAGSTPYLQIYSGTIPGTPDTTATGTLLVALPCSSTLGTSTLGVLTFGAITTTNAVASGTAAYARLTTSASASVSIIDFDVTSTGSGGAVQLNTVAVTVGGPVVVTSAVITEA